VVRGVDHRAQLSLALRREARLLDHDGHLTLETHRIGEVHAWLADRI
jgi:hypothetical protein